MIRSIVLAIWLILIGILSVQGFFSDFSHLPPRILIALLAPLPFVLFISLPAVHPKWLIYGQSFRILVEIGLFILVRKGLIPIQMSFEGLNFDILTGLFAIPVGYYCFVKKTWPAFIIPLYNIIGLLLLITIVAISALSLPSPFRQFPETTLLARFPFIYLPGFLVPLAYTLHIFSLRKFIYSHK